jgi:hypothetical protein
VVQAAVFGHAPGVIFAAAEVGQASEVTSAVAKVDDDPIEVVELMTC